MSLQQINGAYKAFRVSSMDERAIGKLSATNHLDMLAQTSPQTYDKEIVSLFGQTGIYSNDLHNMISNSDPFYLTGNTDSWSYDIQMPCEHPQIIAVPASTSGLSAIGIDGQAFELVFNRDDFQPNDVITAHRSDAPDLTVMEGPTPYDGGFLYKLVLNTNTPSSDSLDAIWTQEGREYMRVNQLQGELSSTFGGLSALPGKIKVMDQLGAGHGISHKITDWADAREVSWKAPVVNGKPMDIQVYQEFGRLKNGKMAPTGNYSWEAAIDMQMKKEFFALSMQQRIWSKGGMVKCAETGRQMKAPKGIYHKIKDHGQVMEFNPGEFSFQMIRELVGSLFQGRVAMKDRRVKLYANERGIEVFQQANIDDLRSFGFTVIPDERFIEGKGRNMMISYAFEAAYSTQTGRVDVIHLADLDQGGTNSELSNGSLRPPMFMAFDITSEDGGPQKNIREVRREKRPNFTYGYVDGTIHHLGFAKSQGMSSANTNPWYELWMKDRTDTHIEDLSKCVLIKQKESSYLIG